jgi:hypothetical protein
VFSPSNKKKKRKETHFKKFEKKILLLGEEKSGITVGEDNEPPVV